jgi:hypothetical protein
MLLDMDFNRDITTPNSASEQPHIRPAPVPFDDMMGSLPPTRPIPQPAPLPLQPDTLAPAPVRPAAPVDEMIGTLPPARPISFQPVTPPVSSHAPKTKRGLLKNRWVIPSASVLLALVAIGLTGYLAYSGQHKKVVSLDGQIVVFNQHISDQQGQITLLQETVPTLTPSATSYNGWTTYTLKYENLTFKYPKNWKLVDTSTNGSDNVSITSLNNFVITINTGAAIPAVAGNSSNIIGITPIDFVGKFAYFDFVSTANDGLVEEGILSQSPTTALQPFASKAVGEHPGTPGDFNVVAAYSSTGDNSSVSESLANTIKDSSYQTAELLIDSMSY